MLAGQGQALTLSLPEGSTEAFDAPAEAGRYDLPTGPAKAGTVPIRTLEGSLRHRVWHLEPIPVEVLLATLRSQVVAAGYEILLDCVARSCGGYDFRFAVEDVGPPAMVVDFGRYGFLSAAAPQDAGYAVFLVSETGSMTYLQLSEISPKEIALPGSETIPAPAAGPSAVAGAETGALADWLLADGHVVLEDLRFATGRATLENGPYASLAALADLLSNSPDLEIALVGHSDAEGAAEANLALSMRRAEAVRDRLVQDYGADPARLRARGVGYLAPRATNRTPEGRRANRRVEAVLTQP